jgi:hypothetical protein
MYDSAVHPVPEWVGVCTLGEWKKSRAEGLVVLRSMVMDPFSIGLPPAPDRVSALILALKHACPAVLLRKRNRPVARAVS